MLKPIKKLQSLILLSISFILILTVVGCSAVRTEDSNSQELEIVELANGRLVGELSFPGVLIPEKSSTISAQISGVVEKVLVEKGQRVKKGEQLLVFDDEDLIVKYNQALAGVKQSAESIAIAKNKLATTEKEFARIKSLYEIKAVSQQDYENYLLKLEGDKSTYQTAEIAAEVARANLKATELQLAKTVLTSPLDGEVVDVEIAEGEMTSSGNSVITIANIDKVIFQTNIPEQYINLLNVGDQTQATFAALSKQLFSGEISHLSPIASTTGQQYPLEATIANSEGILKGGMTGNLKIEVSSEADSLLIPQDAIVVRNGLSYVFKAVDNKAVQTKIKTGLRNKEQVVILEGLTKGNKVIRGDVGVLYDGKEIK